MSFLKMSKKSSKLTTNPDNKPIEVNPFLRTEEKHRDWYEPNVMGKQRGKPRYDLKEIKKPKK